MTMEMVKQIALFSTVVVVSDFEVLLSDRFNALACSNSITSVYSKYFIVYIQYYTFLMSFDAITIVKISNVI